MAGRKPRPGQCPECGVPLPGRLPLRDHRYTEHGIHWDKKRFNRGATPFKPRKWTAGELLFMREHPKLDAEYLSKQFRRSVAAVRHKQVSIMREKERKRLAVEAARRRLSR